MKIRLAGVMVAALLSGCASVETVHYVDDGVGLDPGKAYVLVFAYVGLNGEHAVAASGELTRIDKDGSTQTMAFRVPNGHVQLLAVRPGQYYVSEIHGGPLDYQFGPDKSLFTALPGRVNYPGDWLFATRWDKQEHVTYRSIKYRDDFSTFNALDLATRDKFAQTYPRLSKTTTLVYTRQARAGH